MNLLSHVLPKLWCAGKLGNCPKNLRRFRFTCVYCRWRRRHYGKFSSPPRWITYTLLMSVAKYAAVDKNGQVQAYKTVWKTIPIDPRGHFTMFRCAIIMVFDRIMVRWRRTVKPLLNFCEFFANYPTW